MVQKTLNALRGLEMVTADAFKIGIISDLRYDPSRWKVSSIKIKTEKGLTKRIPSLGSGRSMIQMCTRDFIINDIILMKEEIDDIETFIEPDSDNAPILSVLDGMKVVSKDGIELGTVYDVNVDTDMWAVPTISVKLDKLGFEPLGLKKGLLSKTVISIRTEYIETAASLIMLNQTAVELKDDIVVE